MGGNEVNKWKKFLNQKEDVPESSVLRKRRRKDPEDDTDDDTPIVRFIPVKLGDSCSHPREHWLQDKGSLVGIITVCRLCGRIVKDKDLVV